MHTLCACVALSIDHTQTKLFISNTLESMDFAYDMFNNLSRTCSYGSTCVKQSGAGDGDAILPPYVGTGVTSGMGAGVTIGIGAGVTAEIGAGVPT